MPKPTFVQPAMRKTRTMPVLALREAVIFPHAIAPLFVGREQSMRAVERAYADLPARQIFLVLQKDAEAEESRVSDLCTIGVVCRVIQILRLPDGTLKALFEGLYRATFSNYHMEGRHAEATVAQVPEVPGDPRKLDVALGLLLEGIRNFKPGRGKTTPEQFDNILALNDAGALADSVMAKLSVDYRKKQAVLEILDVAQRVEETYVCLEGESSVLALEKQIKTRVREQMEKSQRDYYLNEQLRAINKELGRDEDPMQELDELTKQLNELDLPEEARKKGLSEIKKLRAMTTAAAEYTILRSYVDWILALPWNRIKDVDIDIEEARRILDSDHFGLEKPKERILEYLAVQKLSKGIKGPILCFVGPPGVGKTSLAKSVARATGREYIRLSLGGVRDEAEIRGHRRTYIGALPGKIIQSLRRVKYNNPLFCLDEIDKLSSDYRGDPAAALLEVLDPEQNNTFMDHYLDLDYDLSKILFITTANSLDIPEPLLDRMEVIELNSYLETEKTHIARDFLIPKQIKENGLRPENLKISDNALASIITDYTAEAGVRMLERQIAKICRKTAVKLLEGGDMDRQFAISRQALPALLGAQTYFHDKREDKPTVGVSTGLAWTSRGGEILFVETSIMAGTGTVVSTGKLGEVMQESAKAAMSYVRAHSSALGLAPDFHKKIDVHVHVPAGATPKDGPSAGITIVTAITSALLGVPVRNDIAMTGEISLRGRVLPIGGLREKLVGAKRAGIMTIIIPKDNVKDLKEVPAEVLKGLDIRPVEHVEEVLELALVTDGESIFSGRDKTPPLYETLRSDWVATPAASQAKIV